ncbi:hypothetical protein LshimejAT787_0904470 [Lyophyllum shimeji]|uniref:DUF7223 domain-containing protein n=1 Tax=Lyophyllum shimeji TaxID=47721 RepID=A0A9P3UQG0_LYOSH|nr:hypothetical protein LshimejAT787_0904470 [Lyophyllum shimeji]
MMHSMLALLVTLATAAHALNDWSKPCLSGVCSYDIPHSAGSSSGSLKIWGSKDAISDITTAAGWEILGCSTDKLSQDIRLVCTSDDPKAAGCSHLYESAGAEGKIVRLPESCGKNAFARVARAWIPEDQSIPASVAGKIVRRDGKQPQVKALSLDTKFDAIDTSKTGPVNFALKGANIKGAAGDIDTSTVLPSRRSRIYGNTERGLFDFVGDAVDAIKNLNDFNVDKSQALKPLTVDKNFNLLSKQLSCPPITASLKIDVDAKANAVATVGVAASGTIVPPKVDDFAIITSLTGDLDGSVTMVATASCTLDSGKVKIFEVGVPGLDFPGVLTIGPTFEVNAQASAQLDLQADLTVGLNYHVEKAQLIFPPDSKKAQAAGDAFSVGDTPLKLSLSPSVKATGTVSAHLIPSINLKISALGDIVKAGVFLDLDASADMSLSLEGTAQGSITVDKAKAAREEPVLRGRYWARGIPQPNVEPRNPMSAAEAPPAKPVTVKPASTKGISAKATSLKVTSVAPSAKATSKATSVRAVSSKTATSVKATSAKATSVKAATSKAASSAPVAVGTKGVAASASAASTAATATGTSKPAKKGSLSVTKDASASFGGCFRIGAGLDVSAGADANFFGLFDPSTKVSLFSRKFEILKKCFGNAKRSLSLPTKLTRGAGQKRALTCAPPDAGAAVNVADQVVQAGTITPV